MLIKKRLDDLSSAIMDSIYSQERDDFHNTIHASDIYDFCIRRYALFSKHDLKVPKRKGSIGEAVTFAIGRKIQDIITDNTHKLWGIWKCENDCQNICIGLRPAAKCECGGRYMYRETFLRYDVHGFSLCGHVDLLVLDGRKSVPEEVKSIAADMFKALKEPMLRHEYQMKSYLWMINKLKNKELVKRLKISPALGRILYMSKGRNDTPIKVYEVKPDRLFDREMDSIVKSLKDFAHSSEVPQRKCSTIHHLMARQCIISDLCFRRYE